MLRNFLVRLGVSAALAVSASACGNGNATSLPFAGPSNGGGNPGIIQSGGTGQALFRFVQGSPDVGKVDICVDQESPGGLNSTSVAYKGSTLTPIALASGISHTIAVYPVPTTGPGTECSTSPGPYFGTPALAISVFTLSANSRNYFVLGGRTGSTLGLYYYPGPTSFVNPPSAAEAQVFNASPTFGKVGTAYVVGGVVTNMLPSLNPPVPSKPTATVTTAGSFGLAALPDRPDSFAAGKPVLSGTVVPLVVEPASGQVTGTTYVASVFTVDSTNAAGLDIVSFTEPVIGYGF